MGPEIMVWSILRVVNIVRLPKDGGMWPVSLLCETLTTVRLWRLPNSNGMWPLKLFALRSRYDRADKEVILPEAIVPCRRLLPRSICVRNGRAEKLSSPSLPWMPAPGKEMLVTTQGMRWPWRTAVHVRPVQLHGLVFSCHDLI